MLQTYGAAEVAFNRYVKLFPKDSWNELWAKKPNESERTVYLTGGREVGFKSGNEYDNLRIETLDGVIIDECREQPVELWTQVIRPMLGRRKGWAEFYSTPNGFDWFYDLYNDALANINEWGVVHAPSTEAWWWTPEEILSAKRSMGEAEFAQEIMAEFRDLTSGKAYNNFGEHNLAITSPIYPEGLVHPMLPIIVGMDFNLSPMAWHLGQKRIDDFYWFDRVFLKGSHTQEAAAVLCQKLIEHGAKTCGVVLAGDATSKAGQRAAAGQSDYDIICQALDIAGIKWENRTPESNPNVKDRVNTVNAHLKDANGAAHLFIHPINCPELIKDFQRVVWKQGAQGAVLDQIKDPMLTHSSDGVGYAICSLSPLTYSSGVGTMKVIMR